MEAESRRWHVQCLTCSTRRSVWDAGGIRWGAWPRTGKRKLVECPTCRRWRIAAIEFE